MPIPGAVPGGSVELRLVLDGSIVEIFADSGETLTLRCYPTGGGRRSLLSRGLAREDVAVEAEAWHLRVPEGAGR
jgi:beta-fructofuranosidase